MTWVRKQPTVAAKSMISNLCRDRLGVTYSREMVPQGIAAAVKEEQHQA